MKLQLIPLLCLFPALLMAQKLTTVISGTIQNADDTTKLVVQKVDCEYFAFDKVGTFPIEKNGNFRVEIPMEEGGIYQFYYKNRSFTMPFQSEQQVKLTFDGAGGYDDLYEVEGSHEASAYLAYRKARQALMKKMNQWQETLFSKEEWETMNSFTSNQEYEAFNEKHPLEMAKLDSAYQAMEKEAVQLLKIIDSPFVLLAAYGEWGIGLQFGNVSPLDYADIVNAMAKKYPDSKWIPMMQKKLKKAAQNSVGEVAPEITMPDTAGQMIKLSSLRGKYVLLEFWASWCAPCLEENPNLVAAYQQYKDQGFTILGISLDTKKGAWTKAIQKYGLTWHHVSDLKDDYSIVKNEYHVIAVPYNLLLDKNGVIIAKNLMGQALNKKLASIFEK